MSKVTCKSCGAEIYETELVCPKCGTMLKGSGSELRLVQEKKLAEEESARLRAELSKKEEEVRKLREVPPPVTPATAPPVQPTAAISQTPQIDYVVSSNVGWMLGLFSFLAPVLGILIAAMFLSRGTRSGHETGENCLTSPSWG
ncbi:MAG: zinc-ribbon domain-containing protein [Armatimonadetes bacterium]|nr:zinc-ribbon domain-containing protein [Armatimonadota bacterium]